MSDYYKADDLGRFSEIGRYSPELFKKFITRPSKRARSAGGRRFS
jgi:hypothetical protein